MSHSPNYLIVTHNTRMRCLLMAIFRNQIKFSVEEKRNNEHVFLPIQDDNNLNFYKDKFKKYKLKNCSVLQIILKKGIFGGIGKNIKCVELEVSLFYEGSIAATEESGEGLCNYWQSNRNRFDLFVTILGLIWIILHFVSFGRRDLVGKINEKQNFLFSKLIFYS